MARERHRRQRTVAAMKLGRYGVVWPAMAELQRQRRLRVRLLRRRNSSGGAAHRPLPVGRDHQLGVDRPAIVQREVRRFAGDVEPCCEGINPLDMRGPVARFDERRVQQRILDIAAEACSPEVGGTEQDLGRAQETAGCVDEAKPAERRRCVGDGRPDAEVLEECDAAAEECRCSRVTRQIFGPRPPPHERDGCTCERNGEGCGQSGWASADNQDGRDC